MSSVLPQTFVDAEGAVRTWARANADISALVDARVFFGVPEGVSPGDANWPMLVVRRVGGAPQPDIAPVDRALIQFDCWGATRRSKAQAAALATAVVTAARELTNGTEMGSGVVGQGADVELGPVWSPDPETDQARYVVDVAFYLRAN